MKKVKIKILRTGAVAPMRMSPGAAGYDLAACEGAIIQAGEIAVIKLGFATEFERGYVARIADRSGLSVRHGIQAKSFVVMKNGIFVTAGVMDSDYRGEWMVSLMNLGKTWYKVIKGDRIAQTLFLKAESPEVEIVDELSGTERAAGGFGSTGL